MNKIISEHINELFDSYDLFGGKAEKCIYIPLKSRFPEVSEDDISELKAYLKGFFQYCVKYADIIAEKYNTPFLLHNEEAKKEISDYVKKCQEQYPEIDEKHITDFFSIVCWLANR